MAEVKHIQSAAGWVTEVLYRREGEPRCARLPGILTWDGAMVILADKRRRAAEIAYVQH